MALGRALIIAPCAVYPVSVCRALARLGAEVHVFAEAGSPVLLSRCCHRGFPSPPWTEGPAFLAHLDGIVDAGAYEAIYLASESILHLLAAARRAKPWAALPLPLPHVLDVFLSKHGIVRRVSASGAPVPRTIVPESFGDLERAWRELGFPLLVKGERGTASAHVHFCEDLGALRERYLAIAAREQRFGGRPALQEYIAGPKYTASGLFRNGIVQVHRLCPPTLGQRGRRKVRGGGPLRALSRARPGGSRRPRPALRDRRGLPPSHRGDAPPHAASGGARHVHPGQCGRAGALGLRVARSVAALAVPVMAEARRP